MLRMISIAGLLIKPIFRSELRLKTLILLDLGPKTLGELADNIQTSKPALRTKIKFLEKNLLIVKKHDKYLLGPKAKVLLPTIKCIVKNAATLREYQKFWDTHFIEGIPEIFLQELFSLYNSQLVEGTDENPLSAHYRLLKFLHEADYVYGVTPILTEEYVKVLFPLVKKGAKVKIVITPAVLKGLQGRYQHKLEEALKHPNFSTRISDEKIRFGLAITDKYISFGLYEKNGKKYDISVGITSKHRFSRDWCQRLFYYYWDSSKECALLTQ